MSPRPVNRGATLIELVLYITIFSLLSLTVMAIIDQLYVGYSLAEELRRVETEGRILNARIGTQIRQATAVSLEAGERSDDILLAMPEAERDPTELYSEDNVFFIRENNEQPAALSSPRVQVEELNFTNLSPSADTDVIRWQLRLSVERLSGGRITRTFSGSAHLNNYHD